MSNSQFEQERDELLQKISNTKNLSSQEKDKIRRFLIDEDFANVYFAIKFMAEKIVELDSIN